MKAETTEACQDVVAQSSLFGTTVMVAVLLLSTVALLYAMKRSRSSSSSAAKKTTEKSSISKKKHDYHHMAPLSRSTNPQRICPYSAESDFLIETAEHLPLEPLDLYQDWEQIMNQENDCSNNNDKPLAARWLNAGISGQDTPGLLRAGLKRLRSSKWFLVEDVRTERFVATLQLKQRQLDKPKLHRLFHVAEADSLEAQQETLELFLDYLPRRYPKEYMYDKEKRTISVKTSIGNEDDSNRMTWAIDDYWTMSPLELCARIVQEDLVLMRPDYKTLEQSRATGQPIHALPTHTYFMAAANVLFSFTKLPERLGAPVEAIHVPVPGYQKHILKGVNLTFSKLKAEKPMWRNNWGLANDGTLEDQRETDCVATHPLVVATTEDEVRSKFFNVEYQTIRRLPKSGYFLFTIKLMVDPMGELEKVPKAAACLASSMRGMSPALLEYKGVANQETRQAILAFLDKVSAAPSLKDEEETPVEEKKEE